VKIIECKDSRQRVADISRRKQTCFWRDTSGAVSAEFVVILPVFIMLFVLIASTSALVVTSSEVQQVSFELTRGSLRYYEPGMSADALCEHVETRLAPDVIASASFVHAEQFTDISCSMDDTDGAPLVAVSVSYDLANNPALMLGEMVGLSVDSFTRSSRMWY
jgi:hypothetical protein